MLFSSYLLIGVGGQKNRLTG